MAHPFVKVAFITLLGMAWLHLAFSGEASYQAEIIATRNRYLDLGNRKAMGESLTPAEDKERLCLLGELTEGAPVWVLTHGIIADIQALEGSGKDLTNEERATADKLSQLLLIALQFVVRRDVDGARAWAKTQ